MENIFNKKEEIIIDKYKSKLSKLKKNKKIRPNLIKENSNNNIFFNLDSKINRFNILNSGKMIFKIYLNSVLNDKLRKTLEFNIYVNNKIAKTLEYPINENFNKNIFLFTELKVNKEDFIYFDFSIKEKKGILIFKEDIYYEIEFSLNENLIYKSSQITRDSFIFNYEGINSKLNKIILNQNEILDLEKKISNLELKSSDTQLPIGTILLGQQKPNYGEWKLLGILEEGQAIIGGETSDGSVVSHNHPWSYGYTAIGNLDKQDSSFSSFNTFSESGNQFWMGKKEGATGIINSFTTEIGGDRNYACGLGIGTGVNVFKRVL